MSSCWKTIIGMFLIVLPFMVSLGYSVWSLGLRQTILIMLLVVSILGCVSGGLYFLQDVFKYKETDIKEEEDESNSKNKP